MILKDFQTILVPSNKTGALQFYHKPTKAILEAAFSAPNIGATSGRTVTRNGQFLELGENDPDWDDANGCPRILFRPQVQNTFATFDPSAAEGANFNVTYSAKNWGFGSLLQNSAVFGDNSVQRLRYGGNCAAGNNVMTFYVEMDDESEPDIQQSISSGDFSVVMNGGLSGVSILSKTNLKDKIWRIVAIGNVAASSANNGIIKYTGQSSKGFTVSGFTLVQGVTTDQGDIPSAGSALTRSANQFTFDDLVTKGVIDSSGDFSIFVKMYLFDTVTFQGDVVEFLNGANVKRIQISKYNSARLRALNVSGTWFTPLTASGEGNKSFVLTFKGSTKEAKVYFQGALQGSATITDIIEGIKLSAKADTLFNLNGGDVMFAPVTLTEAQALAALAEL